MNPDNNPNPNDTKGYTPSRFIQNKQKALAQQTKLGISGVLKSTKEQPQIPHPHELKPKLVPNIEKAKIKEVTSIIEESEPSANAERTEKLITYDNVLVTKGGISGKAQTIDGKKISTANNRVAFGSKGTKSFADVVENKPKKLMDVSIEDLSQLYSKNIIFPIEYPIKQVSEKTPTQENQPQVETQEQTEDQKDITKFIEAITNDYALLQLPANLPLEGCYQQTPKFESTDINLNAHNDLLSALLSNKFDSTGYYLERDFSSMIAIDKNQKEKKENGLVIGKLCKFRNGKIKMKIGENLFDIDEGVSEHFHKEIMAVNTHNFEAFSLLKSDNKFIVKADINDALEINYKS